MRIVAVELQGKVYLDRARVQLNFDREDLEHYGNQNQFQEIIEAERIVESFRWTYVYEGVEVVIDVSEVELDKFTFAAMFGYSMINTWKDLAQ